MPRQPETVGKQVGERHGNQYDRRHRGPAVGQSRANIAKTAPRDRTANGRAADGRTVAQGRQVGWRLQYVADGINERRQRVVEPRAGVEPVRGRQEVFKAGSQLGRVEAQGHQCPPLGARPLHLAQHVRRGNRLVGQQQHQHTGRVKAPDNRIGIEVTGHDVARGDPAGDAGSLERGTDAIGGLHVRRGVADENVTRRRRGRTRLGAAAVAHPWGRIVACRHARSPWNRGWHVRGWRESAQPAPGRPDRAQSGGSAMQQARPLPATD